MRLIVVAAVALMFAATIGCRKNSTSPSQQQGSAGLIPLKIGNKWYYQSTSYNENGSVNTAGTDSISCETSFVLNGTTYYGWIVGSDSGFLGNVDQNTVYQASGNQAGLFFKRVSTDGALITSVPLPFYNGCTGKQDLTGFIHTTPKLGYDCISNEVDSYDCSNKLVDKTIIYLKPGLGWVSTEIYELKMDGSGLYLAGTLNLTSYHLN